MFDLRMFDLRGYLELSAKKVDLAFERLVPDDGTRIIAAMRYAMLGGGKKIRPALCMAAAEAVGGSADSVLEAGCAIEMIHTYSLIHDDLPAMDNDCLRRGRPTCHVAFDEGTAILAGDALLTLAFQVLASIEVQGDRQRGKLLEIIGMVARGAGYQGMIGGQMMDIHSEGKSLPLSDLQALHAMKTGAMIEAAVCTGAVLGGGAERLVRQLREYSRHIGLAFQITDDILNIEGDPALIGKSVGTDVQRQKNTYPGIMGLDQAKNLARHTIAQALHALDGFDERSAALRAIAAFIIERKY